jgi:flagellar protein FliL
MRSDVVSLGWSQAVCHVPIPSPPLGAERVRVRWGPRLSAAISYGCRGEKAHLTPTLSAPGAEREDARAAAIAAYGRMCRAAFAALVQGFLNGSLSSSDISGHAKDQSVASAAAAVEPTKTDDAAAPEAKKPIGRRKLILLAAPVALVAIGGGLWFSGIAPRLLGLQRDPKSAESAKPAAPIYVDLPELITNLNSNPHRPSYLKLQARLELTRQDDVERVKAAMPRLQDLFQTYMREMRPEELRGSAGTYRLREELIARANLAAAPARIADVLFTQMLIQ